MSWSPALRGAAVSALVIALSVSVLFAVAHKAYSPTKLPSVAYAVLLLVPVALSAWVAARSEFTLVRWVPVVVAIIAALSAPWLGRDRLILHTMRWEVIPRTDERLPPDVENLRFRFVEQPEEYVGIYSNDLLPYLRAREGAELEVEFEVTYDLWFTRGFRVVRIGERTHWDELWGGYAGFESTPARKAHSMRFP